MEAIEASTIEKLGLLNLKVGQLTEMRTFEIGFRGAWFRCKIKDVLLKKNMVLLEYYDYEMEKPSWVEIYQKPPYGRKSKLYKRQLMVRPRYPEVYRSKSEVPPLDSITLTTEEARCVVVHDGTWKVGDWVDWFKDDCYWSAKIVKVMSDHDKVQIELPLPPSGEGEEGEEGRHEAFCKDLRPFLEWSETKGWSLPTVEGLTSCDAQLTFPTKQGMDLEDEEHAAAKAAGSPVNAASSTTRVPLEGDTYRDRDSEQNVKLDGDLMESSESSSSLHVKKRSATDEDVEVKVEVEKRELNIMHEHTLEAAMLDLDELINKVNWMQRILQSPGTGSDVSTSLTHWKFS